MKKIQRIVRFASPLAVWSAAMLILSASGCGPSYRDLRLQGQDAMLTGSYGPARFFFAQAEEKKPRHVENLHDLGTCSVMLARERFREMNHAAALREVDEAIAYYSSAIDVDPGFHASLEGKNIALELKGQFDEALEHAEWSAEFVGPSARQYVFLARELEERGDKDAALLRYRQAIAMEPSSASAHRAFAEFLLRNKNDSAAVHHLQAAYRIDPGDPWVLDQLVAHGAVPALAPERRAAPE